LQQLQQQRVSESLHSKRDELHAVETQRRMWLQQLRDNVCYYHYHYYHYCV